MSTVIELHYKFWKWHNLQRSWNIEHFLIATWNTKRCPQNYDVMIWWRRLPRHAPHIWGRRRRCVFDLTYACMCKYPRGSKLSSSNVILRGEVRWLHNVQFCLKSKVSLGHRGRSCPPVSCARNAADDEDLQYTSEVVSASAWIICVLTKNNSVSGDKKPRNSCYSAILKRLVW